MDAEKIGIISGVLVVASIVPYAIRTYQKKVHPNLTSWSLWTLIGLTLLLTYKSSGAEANIWPAVFGFTNPLLIVLLLMQRRRHWIRMSRGESVCLIFGVGALVLWANVRDRQEFAQCALYLALAADLCAAIPTFVFVWTHPDGDRPFAWCLYATGYGVATLAITQHTFANYALPLYMFFISLFVALPLSIFRWKRRIPLKEWI